MSGPAQTGTGDHDPGFSEEPAENPNEKPKFKCNHCDYSNHDKGGMKRHILARHKTVPGTKRKGSHDDDIDDKRSKSNSTDNFDPPIASIQVNIEEAMDATQVKLQA